MYREGNKFNKLARGAGLNAEELEKDFNEVASRTAKKLNLDCESTPDGYEVYIGRCPSSIKDDETGKQFKDSIKNTLSKAQGEDVSCGFHEEAWYNG